MLLPPHFPSQYKAKFEAQLDLPRSHGPGGCLCLKSKMQPFPYPFPCVVTSSPAGPGRSQPLYPHPFLPCWECSLTVTLTVFSNSVLRASHSRTNLNEKCASHPSWVTPLHVSQSLQTKRPTPSSDLQVQSTSVPTRPCPTSLFCLLQFKIPLIF
jgi:hypothetical protein